MALDPPAPRALRAGCAEHREEILVLVAGELAAHFDDLQHVLELDDRRHLGVAACAQAGAQQVVRHSPLRLTHVPDHQPLAREHLIGDEVPAQAIVAGERKRGLGALLGCEAVQELPGGFRHGVGRALGGEQGTSHEGRNENGGNGQSESIQSAHGAESTKSPNRQVTRSPNHLFEAYSHAEVPVVVTGVVTAGEVERQADDGELQVDAATVAEVEVLVREPAAERI